MERLDSIHTDGDGQTRDSTTPSDPGLAAMRATTCCSCHTIGEQSQGPPYSEVATKYFGEADVRDVLARKIITGGTGGWGEQPMPPHPQHDMQEKRQMVDWVLSLAMKDISVPKTGIRGTFTTRPRPDGPVERRDGGVLVVRASYTDNGAAGVPALPRLSA